MALKLLARNDLTDKNSTHSYLDTYQDLFTNIQDSAKNILEIGVYTWRVIIIMA